MIDDFEPTPQLRYVRRIMHTPRNLVFLVAQPILQQLWERHHMGARYTEWRDVPTEDE